jgi:hypothetical protein
MNASQINDNLIDPCGCGGKPRFIEGEVICDRNAYPDWKIQCPSCRIQTAIAKGQVYEGPPSGYRNTELEAKDLLLRTWNTAMRPRPTELPPLAKALLAAVEAIKTHLKEP